MMHSFLKVIGFIRNLFARSRNIFAKEEGKGKGGRKEEWKRKG